MMQADNLREGDVNKLEKAFKEIKKGNPSASLKISLMNRFNRKDCLFREKCKKNRR